MEAFEDVNALCPRERHSSDTSWLLSHCFKILMMQSGFALVESSFVRQKNSANIMMKNVSDLCLGCLAFWATGWALAYGVDANNPENTNGFAGTGQWFLIDEKDYGGWMFQLSFAATAATIDSGAVAERFNFKPYVIYSTLLTGIFYPIVCHWCWDEHGWLTKLGFYDFAGSGPVHMLGGVSALVSAWFIGPRYGRFATNGELEVEILQGENIGGGSESTRTPQPPDHTDGEARKPLPYIVVKQLNHGNRILRTRHAESVAHPRWSALLRFKIHPDEDSTPESKASGWMSWSRWVRSGGTAWGPPSKEGFVQVCSSSEADVDADSVGRWAWEIREDELPPALRDPDASPARQRASTDGEAAEQHESPRLSLANSFRAGLSNRMQPVQGKQTLVFEQLWCAVCKGGVQLRDGAEGRVRRTVQFGQVRKLEKWQLGLHGMTLHLNDLTKLEIKVASVSERDAWLDAVRTAWRPALSPMHLRFHVVDHASAEVMGQADLTINASDKPDPLKFRLSSMLRLSCGGRLEVAATYTSADRLTREIFQSWDPVKLLFGTFVLWVNWFSFNTGSTFGVVGGGVELAAKVAVTTILAAAAGATASMVLSEVQAHSIMVEHLATGILGSLVAITACCSVVTPWESIVVGALGALLSNLASSALERLRIDDPCGAFAVHGAAGAWGVLAVGLFAAPEPCMGIDKRGLFRGGGWGLLGVQALGCVSIIAWSAVTCLSVLGPMAFLSKRFACLGWMSIRPSKATEAIGFDQTEHNIHRTPPSAADPLVSTHAEDETVHSVAKKRWGVVRKGIKAAASFRTLGKGSAFSGGDASPSSATAQEPRLEWKINAASID